MGYAQAIDLFSEQIFYVPKTEGIKYVGSKLKILPHIIRAVLDLGKDNLTFLDGFSGSTRVSQAFAQLGYQITTNDISEWSRVFSECYLLADKSGVFYQNIIDCLNSLDGYEGWFTENYGGETKSPFQKKNLMKLDAIRDEIDKLNLEPYDKSVILASLILALDSVDNTLGHYVSYLKDWSARSYSDLFLKLPERFHTKKEHCVLQDDIFNVIRDREFDIAYFDPPYGSNNDKMPASRVRYNGYYHLWTTIIKNDRPKLFGKANRRVDSRDTHGVSVFEEFRTDENGNFLAMNAIDKLIKETKAKYILLSYSSGGRATINQLNDIIHKNGELLKILKIDYKKNVMANMKWTNQWAAIDNGNQEFIFVLKKDI